ncbi:hypothetical protein D3C76_1087600 [compost metagenome]
MFTDFFNSFSDICICSNDGIYTFGVFAKCFGNCVLNGTNPSTFQFTINIDANYGCITEYDAVRIFNTFHLLGKGFKVIDSFFIGHPATICIISNVGIMDFTCILIEAVQT